MLAQRLVRLPGGLTGGQNASVPARRWPSSWRGRHPRPHHYDGWHSDAVEPARERMLRSAVRLMQQNGVAGTSLADVIAHSGAPRGSIYHHFPRGKAQLVEEATRRAGDHIAGHLAAGEDPREAVRALVGFWRTVLLESDFAAGCPVAAAAAPGEDVPGAQSAAGEIFARWQHLSSGLLRRRGVPGTRADSLAALAVAGVEGAILLARAQRDLAPLEQVGAELERSMTDALTSAPDPAS